MPGITRRLEPLVLRGSLTRFRRRCGKANCHCVGGEPHESPALVYSEDGRTKTLTLAEGEVAEVAAALDRYEIARAQLDAAANAGIASLRARRAGPPRKGERP